MARDRGAVARAPSRAAASLVRTQERLFAANGVQVHGAAEVFAALCAAGRITKRHGAPAVDVSIWHAAATAR